MKNNILSINSLLWLALALALAGSLKHLAVTFASIDNNIPLGWIQAIAIDVGLFALAYSIKIRKTYKRSIKVLWLGVGMFSLISIYGNLTYGLTATNNLLQWIVVIKPYILAGSLPILVLFLSELLSDDRQFAKLPQPLTSELQACYDDLQEDCNDLQPLTSDLQQVDTTLQPVDNTLSTTLQPVDNKSVRLQQLKTILKHNPTATNADLANELQVSYSTISNYKRQLQMNGNGVK